MRLGVSAHRLSHQRLGVGRYIEYLLKYWRTMIAPPDRVTMYVQQPFDGDGMGLNALFESKVLEPRLSGVLWENLLLPPQASSLDVLFGPNYTLPLTYRGKSVVATHSINETEATAHPWWYAWRYSLIYKLSARKADKVIVPSHSVKSDMQRHYAVPAGKIEVVPEGADDAFQPIDDPEVLRATRRRYLGADKPYILFVGKFSQRRNIPLLLRAFAAVKKRENIPHSLLLNGPNITGVPVSRLAAELQLADSVVHVNDTFSDHRELVPVYAAADAYVFPSAYEGFSLTTTEALACGVPVIATNRAALAEIGGGGAALLVDDLTVDAFADAISQVLGDSKLREQLRTRGVERARSLRWEQTARGTLDVLREVARC